jgi:putative addiction module killer protein
VIVELQQSAGFARWLRGLRDQQAKQRILARLRRLSLGNPGDVRAVGGGVSEMRVDYGPGYRVYFASRGPSLVILLTGGDKRSQQRDIEIAISLARVDLEDD